MPLRSRTSAPASPADRATSRPPAATGERDRRPNVIDLSDDEPLGLASGRSRPFGAGPSGEVDRSASPVATRAARPHPTSPPPPAEQLQHALDDLGQVFGGYPFRPAMRACPHCVSDDDLRQLGRAPARISTSLLDRYLAKSMVTWGDVADFKRLLPEVMVRLCEGRTAAPGALVGARLRRAGWTTWPAAETPAVRRTLSAMWLTTLAAPPGPGRDPVVARLSLVTAAESDLEPYLDVWEDRLEAGGDPAARLAAVLHLADLLAPLAVGGRRRLTRGFPLARRSVVGQLDHWLRQPVVIQRLAHAAGALESTPHGPLVTQARAGLARLRAEG